MMAILSFNQLLNKGLAKKSPIARTFLQKGITSPASTAAKVKKIQQQNTQKKIFQAAQNNVIANVLKKVGLLTTGAIPISKITGAIKTAVAAATAKTPEELAAEMAAGKDPNVPYDTAAVTDLLAAYEAAAQLVSAGYDEVVVTDVQAAAAAAAKKKSSGYDKGAGKSQKSVSDDLSEASDYELLNSPVGDTRQITKINRFHMQIPEGQLSTKGFIFFTRPNLNLFETSTNTLSDYKVRSGTINPDLARLPTFNYIYNLGRDEDSKSSGWLGDRIYRSLMGLTDTSLKTPWLSIFTNQFTGYSPVNRELDFVQVSTTFHGNTVLYGEPTFKHKIGGTISIDFKDRRDLSLYYTLKLWAEYIQAVTLGYASPYRRYIGLGILDYAASAYYVVTDETMENILYWEKLTGIFPLTVPDETFGTQEGTNAKDLAYSINFAYSMRSVQHEAHLIEINALYKIKSDNIRMSVSNGNIEVAALSSASAKHASLATYANQVSDIFNNDSLSDDQKVLKTIHSYYSRANVNLGTKSADARRFFYIDGGGEVGKFYPNYIKEYGIHGVPYVNGPFITMGTSSQYAAESQLGGDKSKSTKNKGQYKLRWV